MTGHAHAEINIGRTWFAIGAVGVIVNCVGSWLWLGPGLALFTSGLLMVVIAATSVAGLVVVLLRQAALAHRSRTEAATPAERRGHE